MRDKIRAARMRQKFPTRMTSIEQVLHDAFTERKWPFEMHVSLFGRWQPDFVFRDAKLIVQADGEYWHSRPSQVEKDEVFNKAAANDGWAVLRFPGEQIKRHLADCLRQVETGLQIKTA